jgi:hypothetical protein
MTEELRELFSKRLFDAVIKLVHLASTPWGYRHDTGLHIAAMFPVTSSGSMVVAFKLVYIFISYIAGCQS